MKTQFYCDHIPMIVGDGWSFRRTVQYMKRIRARRGQSIDWYTAR